MVCAEEWMRKRVELLLRLYELTDGSEFHTPLLSDVAKALGLDDDSAWQVARYLAREGLLEIVTAAGELQISHQGVKVAESLIAARQEEGPPSEAEPAAATRRCLRSRIDLDFAKTSLNCVLQYIAEVSGLHIVVDPDIASVGIDLNTRVVDFKCSGVSVEKVLTQVLGADLAFAPTPDYLLVTTREAFYARLETKTYVLGFPDQDHAIALIDLVQRTVNSVSDPDVAPWMDEGGSASVEWFGGKMVVTQTYRAHEKIQALLSDIGRQHPVGADSGSREGRLDQESRMTGALATSVFVAHGHDVGARDSVARLIEAIGLRPVILAEQPSKGRTVIEKFEHHAQETFFGVVVLTPDDLGAAKRDLDRLQNAQEKIAGLRPRARQNAVLELGYLCARLGRSRVCCVYKGDLEIPSDYGGVIYIGMDAEEAWRYKLGREVREAAEASGVDVDLSKL